MLCPLACLLASLPLLLILVPLSGAPLPFPTLCLHILLGAHRASSGLTQVPDSPILKLRTWPASPELRQLGGPCPRGLQWSWAVSTSVRWSQLTGQTRTGRSWNPDRSRKAGKLGSQEPVWQAPLWPLSSVGTRRPRDHKHRDPDRPAASPAQSQCPLGPQDCPSHSCRSVTTLDASYPRVRITCKVGRGEPTSPPASGQTAAPAGGMRIQTFTERRRGPA